MQQVAERTSELHVLVNNLGWYLMERLPNITIEQWGASPSRSIARRPFISPSSPYRSWKPPRRQAVSLTWVTLPVIALRRTSWLPHIISPNWACTY